jgi:thiamine-monophosphate kinase
MRKAPAFRNETEFLAWVRRRTGQPARGLRLGIGDDAALVEVPQGQELILTTDMSIEGVHFTAALHPPRAVGHRALARSLSDIAAMGGTPRYALISLALSERVTRTWMEEFFQGLQSLARRLGVAVIGGDTAIVRAPTLIDVIVAGEVPRGRALRRSGARPGDRIFVSGRLGLSALGLRLLPNPARHRKPPERAAIRAHLFPQPQCALGRFLSGQGLATALMDLSDGLSTDLKRLCDASGVGARLFRERIPTPQLPDAADALELALDGGEDYQLLFTVSPRRRSRIPPQFGKIPLHCIGEIEAARRLDLITPEGKRLPLEPRGYDHFARR